MKYVPRRDAFSSCTSERHMPDPYDLCPVCGEYIYWPDEEIGWDKNNQLCHAECVGKDDEMEIKTQDKPVWDWTVREQHEYCKDRVSKHGGDCVGSTAKECSLYKLCCECPDQWEECV